MIPQWLVCPFHSFTLSHLVKCNKAGNGHNRKWPQSWPWGDCHENMSSVCFLCGSKGLTAFWWIFLWGRRLRFCLYILFLQSWVETCCWSIPRGIFSLCSRTETQTILGLLGQAGCMMGWRCLLKQSQAEEKGDHACAWWVRKVKVQWNLSVSVECLRVQCWKEELAFLSLPSFLSIGSSWKSNTI